VVRRGYPPEFRPKVLDLVEAGRPIAEVAKALGISDQSISTWRQDRIDRAGARPDQCREGRVGRGQAADRRAGDRAAGHPAGDGAGPRGGTRKRRFQAVRVMAAEHIPSRSPAGSWTSRPPASTPGSPDHHRRGRSATPGSPISSSRCIRTPAAPTAPCGCMPSCGWAMGSWSATTRWRC
jgi:transposase